MDILKNIMKIDLKNRKNERGNVLFLILIAVALFAALSYAVTSSSRSGGGDANSETNLINSATITQYPASIRTAIVRMIIGGRDETTLNFDKPVDFATTCDATPGPCVFHPGGGGATRVTASPDVVTAAAQTDWIFTSDFGINLVGSTNATNASNEIIAFLPGISSALCAKINEELGITVGTDADVDGIPDAGVAYTNRPVDLDEMDNGNAGIGPAAAGASKRIGGDFDSQAFGCADFDSAQNRADDSDLYYFHVLIER